MASVAAEVKRWLELSHRTEDTTAVPRAFTVLKASLSEKQSQPIPSELPILCCEQAIAEGLWDIAKDCTAMFSKESHSSKALEARALFCEGLVQSHFIMPNLSSQDVVEERQTCASLIVRGITLGIEEWPRDSWIVVKGIGSLWTVMKPLYYSGDYKSVLDVVFFVLSLLERFTIGGGYTHIQWTARLATCLRAVGRHQEAIEQLTKAIDSAVYLKNERLQVQLYRLLSILTVEANAKSSKSDGYSNLLPKSTVHQAVFLSQIVLCRLADRQLLKQDLVSVYERLSSGTVDVSRSSKFSRPSKQLMPENEISDPEVLEEVLSDVILTLALCRERHQLLDEGLQKLLHSLSSRARTFGILAETVLAANAAGLGELYTAPDASYITSEMRKCLGQCIKDVENALHCVHTIEDPSERRYTLQVGCSLLWTYCLPLLQENTHAQLRLTLHRMSEDLGAMEAFIPWLQTCVECECCLAELNEDTLSLAKKRVDDALTRGYEAVGDEGLVTLPMDFQIRWLRHRVTIRGALQSNTLSSSEDQALYNLEKAMISSIESKRVALLKAAFNKLPPLVDPSKAVIPIEEREAQMKEARHRKSGSMLIHKAVPRRPLAQLYYMMLQECRRHFVPAIAPIATALAEALSDLRVSPDGPNQELVRIRAEAQLFLVDLLTQEGTTATSDRDAMEHEKITRNLVSAAGLGCARAARGDATEWITINACQMYLRWQSPQFSRGCFDGVLVPLNALYSAFHGLGLSGGRECKLTVDLSLALILAHLYEYVVSKGEVNGELHAGSYEEFIRCLLLYPRCEPSSVLLKRALEISGETQQRTASSSMKAYILLLHPCLCRLLNATPKVDHTTTVQEQLLFVLGRMSGPLSKEEKISLINRDALDLLTLDPSVQLCGRVAVFAEELGQESTVLEVCGLADELYATGKLGWCSSTAPGGSTSSSSKSPTVPPTFPLPTKPTVEDWFWYARLLRCQATVYVNRCQRIGREFALRLGVRVLTICTNSAIAAGHSHVAARFDQVRSALMLYYDMLTSLWKGACSTKLLTPSLQMILRKHVLKHVMEADGEKGPLHQVLSSLGLLLIRCLVDEGQLKEGLESLAYLRSVLPSRYQRQFNALEMQHASQLGLSHGAIGKRLKGTDPETEALAWMTVAHHAENRSDCMAAWNAAIAAVSQYPIPKAACLLGLAHQLSMWGDCGAEGIMLMLHSALALVETGQVVHPASPHAVDALRHLADIRSQTLGTMMIGTLTGRSLILTSTTHQASEDKNCAQLLKNYGSASTKHVVLSLSIVYLLFCLAPHERPVGANSVMTKREYAVLAIHYVECLWRLCANALDQQGTKGLLCPSHFGDWFGFFFEEKHVKALAASGLLDPRDNTEATQGLLFRVAEYLLSEGMPQFCFMVYSWIHLAAALRYGINDFRTIAVQRATSAKSSLAGIAFGAGKKAAVYATADPEPLYWYTLQECLSEGHLQSQPVSWLYCNPFQGMLHDTLLFEAESDIRKGRREEAGLLADMVLPYAKKISDHEAVCTCLVIKATYLVMEGKPRAAYTLLVDEATIVEKISPTSWLRWQLCKLWMLSLLHEDALLQSSFLTLRRSCEQVAHRTSAGGVARTVSIDVCQRLLDALDIAALELLDPAVVLEGVDESIREECIQRLSQSCSIRSRFEACCHRFRRRPQATSAFPMCGDDVDVPKFTDILRHLHEEAGTISALLTEVRALADELQSTLMSWVEGYGRSPQRAMESCLLRMLAVNALERLRAADHLQQVYRCLGFDALKVPSGEGPPELERRVLQYIRDPTLESYEEYHECILQEWCAPVSEWSQEMLNVFAHFGVPAELQDRVCRYTIYGLLQGSRELAPPGSRSSCETTLQMLHLELQRCLELLVPSDSPIEIALRDRRLSELAKKWSAAPLSTVEKTPHLRRTLSDRHRNRKEVPDHRPPVRDLTEKEGAILEMLYNVISNAQKRYDFACLSECYLLLSSFYILWDHPYAACHAVEFTLAAKIYSVMLSIFNQLVEDGEESRMWKSLQYMLQVEDAMDESNEYVTLRSKLLAASPMFQRLELVASWPEDPNTLPAASVQDGPCLTILITSKEYNSALIVLRHAEGGFDFRTKTVDIDRINQLAQELHAVKEHRRQELLQFEGTNEEAFQRLIASLQEFLLSLLGEFEELLRNLPGRQPLYLCLDPILQPLPIEHTPFFSSFSCVQREISVVSILGKQAQRPSARAGAPLYVIDPFGENDAAVETLLGVEGKPKAAHTVLTCSRGPFPLAPSYLAVTMQSPAFSAIILDMCGRLTSILPLEVLATIRLDHIHAMLVVADGVNDESFRREQRNTMASNPTRSQMEENWVVALLLLLRGVRSLSTNWYPANVATNDALCKRSIPGMLAARGAAESGGSAGKHKEVKRDHSLILFGVKPSSAKAK